jgi:hypothetical protein
VQRDHLGQRFKKAQTTSHGLAKKEGRRLRYFISAMRKISQLSQFLLETNAADDGDDDCFSGT